MERPSREIPQDLADRREKIKLFIDQNFGSQREFCRATDLKPARVSKALQDRYISNRRLLPLEHAISQWRTERGYEPQRDDLTVPVYRLDNLRLKPIGVREPIGPRALGDDAARDRLIYVEITYGHHAVVDLLDPHGVTATDLHGTAAETAAEYAAVVKGQWTYVSVRFDEDGHAELPAPASEARLFGPALVTLHPRG